MKFLKIFILSGIFFYQKGISPLIGKNCRYIPSCSNYMKQSLLKYNIITAFFMIFKRIIRCHPWGNKGYDPIK
ncbi:membrane protein insertion efficiency factor YidD [Blattabacterium cuenoti]|uniref:membrane protein insertion efficiency factor YidD n=1 Tax=Blattabacterium cuenoti TaxID=1653831 RepID=UPI00163D0BA7|nr:membrane protein insertion efficiency factor YidD [Blattabacterium cuenoti]